MDGGLVRRYAGRARTGRAKPRANMVSVPANNEG